MCRQLHYTILLSRPLMHEVIKDTFVYLIDTKFVFKKSELVTLETRGWGQFIPVKTDEIKVKQKQKIDPHKRPFFR